MSKLYLNEPLKPSDGPIVVSDEQYNDVAEFFHDEESTVKVTYVEALAYAEAFIKTSEIGVMWSAMDSAPKNGRRVDLWTRRESTGYEKRYADCWWGRRAFGAEYVGNEGWRGIEDDPDIVPVAWMHIPHGPVPF